MAGAGGVVVSLVAAAGCGAGDLLPVLVVWCGAGVVAAGGVLLLVAGGGVVVLPLLPVIGGRWHCITGTARGARPAMDAGHGDLLPVAGRVVRRLVSCAYISTISTAAGGRPASGCVVLPVAGDRRPVAGRKNFFQTFSPYGGTLPPEKNFAKRG